MWCRLLKYHRLISGLHSYETVGYSWLRYHVFNGCINILQMSGYSYVLWTETQQRSVISNSSIQGSITEGSEIKAKWRGRLYDATVMKTGRNKC